MALPSLTDKYCLSWAPTNHCDWLWRCKKLMTHDLLRLAWKLQWSQRYWRPLWFPSLQLQGLPLMWGSLIQMMARGDVGKGGALSLATWTVIGSESTPWITRPFNTAAPRCIQNRETSNGHPSMNTKWTATTRFTVDWMKRNGKCQLKLQTGTLNWIFCATRAMSTTLSIFKRTESDFEKPSSSLSTEQTDDATTTRQIRQSAADRTRTVNHESNSIVLPQRVRAIGTRLVMTAYFITLHPKPLLGSLSIWTQLAH